MNTSRTPLIILPCLVMINLAVLLLSAADELNTGFPTMTLNWGLIPLSLTHSFVEGGPLEIGYDLLTLFTCTFLHSGFDHFFFNMVMLCIFGVIVERTLGTWRFLGLYVASGFFASFGHYMLHPLSRSPLIGASGAIAGILGAYLVCVFGSGQRITALRLIGTATVLQWLVQQFASVFGPTTVVAGTAVAYGAHVSGFFAGLLITAFMVAGLRRRAAMASEEEDEESTVVDWEQLAFPTVDQPATPNSGASPNQEAHDRALEQFLNSLEQRGTPPNGDSEGPQAKEMPNGLDADKASTGENGSPVDGHSTSTTVISGSAKVPKTKASRTASEAPPIVRRPAETGYQPDKNDSIID